MMKQMRADDSYMAPHNKHAGQHAKKVENTFMYTFTYRSDGDQRPDWVGESEVTYVPYVYVQQNYYIKYCL